MKIPNTKIEPFAEFAERGYGVPFLAIHMHLKTASVEWLCDYGDGGMYRWSGSLLAHFKWEVGHSTMDNELLDIWQRHRPQLNRRAEFTYGGSIGSVCHVPHAMAIEMYNIVREHYARALQMLVDLTRVLV